jgi:hypothetical protein
LVEITVSPVVTEWQLRVLEVSWEVEGWEPGDWIGVHEGSLEVPPSVRVLVRSPTGWVRTQLQENREYADPVFVTTCYKHVAAYWRNNSSKPSNIFYLLM